MNPPAYTPADDQLPDYKPTLLHYDIVLLKRELSSPFDIAKDRRWDIAIVEINSTQLNLYKLKNLNNISQYLWKLLDDGKSIDERRSIQQKISRSDSNFTNKALCEWLLMGNSKSIPESIINPYIDTKLNSYTLQNCKVGSATDYHKKHYTLRLRIELHQLLLSFMNVSRFNKFFNNLTIAMDLSKPLDERCLPKEKTVPNEISRFRIENFQSYYAKNCNDYDRNLSNYRRNTIDHTSALNREDLIIASTLKSRSNSLNDLDSSLNIPRSISTNSSVLMSDIESIDMKPSFGNVADEFIDENLIYSLTCITSLEAKTNWKGSAIITGNHLSENLKKFKNPSKNAEYKNKLFINNSSVGKFHKIISNNSINNCKEFVVMDAGLVEAL